MISSTNLLSIMFDCVSGAGNEEDFSWYYRLQSLLNQTFSRTRNYQMDFSHHLHSLLMYLKNKKLENISYNIIAENIDVAIDFLLVFLDADVSNHVNNDKDETSDTGDIYSMRALEKPKDLKALVKSYYKSLKFTASQFYRTFGGLRFLDSLLSKLNEFFSLPTILKEIKQINAEVTVMWSADVALKPYYVEEPSKHLPSQHRNPVGDDDDIVGFYIATEKVIWHLTRGTRYNQRDLLQKIFSQVTGSMDKGEKDDILTDKLRENLIGKRYLIVLDDMWDGIEWDNLRLFFPDGGKHCAENGLFFSYKMKILLPQGWYEQGIFSTFLSRNKIPSWFIKLVVRSILKDNLFEHYYVQTAGSEGGVEEEEDDDDSILDYDNDDEDEEATLVEIEELFGDLGE
ncbi:hypothetical protein BC332_33632 [Capsicum chinense]|nr:hypothetical protein BC332_33632 [Capsicum chinense]